MVRKGLFFTVVMTLVVAGVACTKSQPQQKTVLELSPSDSDVVAMIGEEKITEEDFLSTMDLEIKGEFSQAHTKYREAKENAVTQVVFERLLEKEASQKGITKEELYEQEVVQKIKKVSDKEVEAFYNDAKKRFEDAGRQPPPLDDQIKAQIEDSMVGERASERQNQYVNELFSRYEVALVMPEAIRFDVGKGTNPAKGKEGASVVVVEFSDFHCPFCQKGSDNMKEVMKKYGSKIEYRYRDFPLEQIHPRAKFASLAARCASDQGKFWQYHDKIFENQSLKEDEEFEELAKNMGLDMEAYNECYQGQKYMSEIQADIQEGQASGVRGTPAYFINGVFISGAVAPEKLISIIEKELNKNS